MDPSLWRRLLVSAWVAAFVPVVGAAVSYEYWQTGDLADAQPAKTRGGVMLSGGGGDVAAAWRWFVDCAGGGDIVVLRASGGDGLQDYVYRQIGGADSVETIKFNDESAARDARVLELIAKADGIFIAGGDQSRYVRWWKNTPVGEALNRHIAAGKPIGGTSAGLAVLGEYYFAAFHESITSETALLNPYDQSVTIGNDFLAVPVMRGVFTDSHFMARNRLGRLCAFLARSQSEWQPQRLLGMGIDELTVACVEPDGQTQIFTEKNGCVWLVIPTRAPEQLAAEKALVHRQVRVIGLGPKSTLNLSTLEVTQPEATKVVTAVEGKLVEEPATP